MCLSILLISRRIEYSVKYIKQQKHSILKNLTFLPYVPFQSDLFPGGLSDISLVGIIVGSAAFLLLLLLLVLCTVLVIITRRRQQAKRLPPVSVVPLSDIHDMYRCPRDGLNNSKHVSITLFSQSIFVMVKWNILLWMSEPVSVLAEKMIHQHISGFTSFTWDRG